jgi:hypothetical protein
MSVHLNSDNELAAIRQELDQLRQTVAAMRGNQNGNGSLLEPNAITDRRGMLKTVAGLAVGMATVGLLRPSSSSGASKFVAKGPENTGDPFITGAANFVSAATDVTYITGNSTTTLIDTLFLAQNYGSTSFTSPGGNLALVGYINNAGTGQTGDLFGVYGESRAPAGGFTYGVYGISDDIGVYGEGNNSGCGVDGFIGAGGATNAFGVRGISSNGVGGAFSGGRSALNLAAGSVNNPNTTPPSGNGIGDVYRGLSNGSVWFRTGAATNPYQRLADNTTAGALTLQAPMRLVDTRTGSGFFDAGNHYGSDTLRTYNIITLSNPDLPTGTRGVVGRITVANATAAGGVQQSPNGPPGAGNDLGFGTAVLSFPPATTIPSFGVPFISALDASGNIRIHSVMGAGQTCDLIVDITGYYL